MLGRWGAASKRALLGLTEARGLVPMPVKALPCGSLVWTGNSDAGGGSPLAPDHWRSNQAAKPFLATAPGMGSSRKLSSAVATSRQPVCLVIGAGEGAGQAIARRFGREMPVCVVRRPKPDSMAMLDQLVDDIARDGGTAHAFGIDARKEEDVAALVQKIEDEIGPLSVLVFNIGANVRFSVLDTTVRVYTKVWEMACLAGFISARECAKVMVPRMHGTIIFTGATASLRGASGFSAFSGAKHALRALAQSCARELGPKGIHVSHVIIDGAVDTPWVRENFAQQYLEMKGKGGVVEPELIAEQYWQLHVQRREAWTHEMELRPWTEKW